MIRDLLQQAGLCVHSAAEPEQQKFDSFHNLLSQHAKTMNERLFHVGDLQLKIMAGILIRSHREPDLPQWFIDVYGKRKLYRRYELGVGYVHGSQEQYKLEYRGQELIASWLVNNNPDTRNINDLMRLVVAAVVSDLKSRHSTKKAVAATEPAQDQDVQKTAQWQRILDFFAQPRRVTYKRDRRVFVVSRQPRPYQGPKWCIQIQLEGNRDRSVRFRLDYTYYHDLVLHASYHSLVGAAPAWDFGVIRNPSALLDPQQFVAATVHAVDRIPNQTFAFQPEPDTVDAAVETVPVSHAGWRWYILNLNMDDTENAHVMRQVYGFCLRKRLVPVFMKTKYSQLNFTVYCNENEPNWTRRRVQKLLLAVAKKFNASETLLRQLGQDHHISTMTVAPGSISWNSLARYGFTTHVDNSPTTARALDLVRQVEGTQP